MSDNALLSGVCCQYCAHFETAACPVSTASPWSRWKHWCSEYAPNPAYPEALSIEAAILARRLAEERPEEGAS
jgi:hypothetical protein